MFTKIYSGAQNFTNDRTRSLSAIDGFAGHYSAANEPVTFTDSLDSITTESDRLTDYFNKMSLRHSKTS